MRIYGDCVAVVVVFVEDNVKHEAFQYTKEFFDKLLPSRECCSNLKDCFFLFLFRNVHICSPDFDSSESTCPKYASTFNNLKNIFEEEGEKK